MSLSKKFCARIVVAFIGLFALLHTESASARSADGASAVSMASGTQSTIGDQGTKGTGSAG